MSRHACVFGLVLMFAGNAQAQAKAKPIAQADLKAAARKAIELIQHSQTVWYKKAGCVSCHHQTLPALVLSLAQERGVAFDEMAARAVTARTFSHLKDLDAIVQGYDYIDEVDEAWKLVAAHAAGVAPSLSTSANAQFLASAQRSDGSWHTMDARPPQSHSRFTTTALCAQAVRHYLPETFADQKQEILRRARAWFLKAVPRTTEDRTFQLLGLAWTGADKESRHKAARQLLDQQRDDGGWSQLPDMNSDAYATGQALFALHEGMGLATDDAKYQKGLHFLLKTQEADGSWHVKSRVKPMIPVSPRYFDAGFPPPDSHDQFISIMGSQWATLALLEAVTVKSDAKARPRLKDFEPADEAPWIHAALNESVVELTKALDTDMKANLATARGTTALMLAARDPQKVKLLLARGANVHAQADSGLTALTVAARHHGNSEVVRLLLAKGAKPGAAKKGEVKNDASPLFFAATSGDVATARALIEAGAAVDAEMRVLGKMRQTPLAAATLRGDSAMVKYLLSQRANPNWADDDDRVTPLQRAVINNHLEIVSLLLAGGAKIDHADAEGFTALHYAASVYFGETTVAKNLLAAGADRSLKDDNGKTALDLARAHGHAALEAVLKAKHK